jgi:2'-5' RNA ligase
MKKIDKNQLDLFGPQIWYEYLLAISPDQEVTQEVTLRKQKVQALIGPDATFLDSKAYITLLTFLHTEHELIIKRVKEILGRQTGFHIKLSGAAFFEPSPESRTLYIRVAEKFLVQALTDQLREGIGRGKKSNPHLTIAGDLSSRNHQVISAQLTDFKLETDFICNGITLLRRLKDDPDSKWDLKLELPFGSVIKENVKVPKNR